MIKTTTKYPTLSFCIATYNAEKTFERVLKSISEQDYQKNLIEIVIADGGSRDATLEIAKRYKAKVIKVASALQGAEYNKSVAVNSAKNEILVEIDQDNILPDSRWLKRMVNPLIEDKEIVGVEPLRYKYLKSLSLMDRYFALFGVNDPLPYYLGKADRLSYLFEKYNLFGNAQDCGDYYKVAFIKQKIPTLGANGFLVRRKELLKNAQAGIGEYLHIDVCVDLINRGFNKFAFVKTDIIHESTSQGLFIFIKRRKYFMEKYHLKDFSKRRFSVFMFPQDFWGLVYFIVISVTFIKPIFDSIRGYFKIKDIAWFVHPVLCFCMTFVYGYTLIKFKAKNLYAGILGK